MAEIRTAALLDDLWPPRGDDEEPFVYALLDAARDPGIYPAVLDADCAWCSLYRGESAHLLADSAPYLVKLEWQSRFTPWLLDRGWGRSWGIFLISRADLKTLRRHFRRLLMVQIPGGKTVYFRFYDPRVLRVYLPSCTAEELEAVFGPVDRYLIEDQDGATAIRVPAPPGTSCIGGRSL